VHGAVISKSRVHRQCRATFLRQRRTRRKVVAMTIAVAAALLAAAVAVAVALLAALAKRPAIVLTAVSVAGALGLTALIATPLTAGSLRGFEEHLPVLAAATTLLIAAVALALVLRRQATQPTLEARTAAPAASRHGPEAS